MNGRAAIERGLREAEIAGGIVAMRNLSGGCIHQVVEVELDCGRRIVAKVTDRERAHLFEEESHGLRLLGGTRTVLVPEPLIVTIADGRCVLLMSHLESAQATTKMWQRFGGELAALHAADAGGRYGLDSSNHLGTTFQPNTWCDDWVEFNARYRLGHQLTRCRDGKLLESEEAARIERIIARLDQFIPRRPKPALLHGDLWSGNALPTRDADGEARIAVIDPAVSIGDGWADIAMMRLFGGFPEACFEAYAAAVADRDQLDTRIAVYQLYHVLNHINIFGRGYAGQAMALARALGA